MNRKSSLAAIAVVLPLLAACGTTTEDRTLGGAALGAGFGALIGIGAGGVGVLPGAAIGAVAGSTTGALTEPERLNFGRPVWKQEDVRAGAAAARDAITEDDPSPQPRATN